MVEMHVSMQNDYAYICHNFLCGFSLVSKQVGDVLLLELIDDGCSRMVSKRRRKSLIEEFVVDVASIVRNPDFNIAQLTQIYVPFQLEKDFCRSFTECLDLSSTSEFRS